jgi:hypothetical protein
LIGHDHPNKPANGERMIRQSMPSGLTRGCGRFGDQIMRSLIMARDRTQNRIPLLLIARWNNGTFCNWTGAALGAGRRKKSKGGCQMFQGHIDQDTAIAVEASAIPDVLFERGLYWASGRSGVVNLVAAHKWFNLAALKGRTDAMQLRREVAELMSEVEIAMAQREARTWMTTH